MKSSGPRVAHVCSILTKKYQTKLMQTLTKQN